MKHHSTAIHQGTIHYVDHPFCDRSSSILGLGCTDISNLIPHYGYIDTAWIWFGVYLLFFVFVGLWRKCLGYGFFKGTFLVTLKIIFGFLLITSVAGAGVGMSLLRQNR